MPEVFIALGSNLGDRLANMQRACIALRAQVSIAKCSPVYETEPMYLLDQPPFYNAIVCGNTEAGPLQLLRFLKATERKVGRTPSDRHGPREIDIDMISYGVLGYRFADFSGDRLLVPHPKTAERRFVLQPMADIAPEYNLPGLGTVSELLSRIEGGESGVRVVENAVL